MTTKATTFERFSFEEVMVLVDRVIQGSYSINPSEMTIEILTFNVDTYEFCRRVCDSLYYNIIVCKENIQVESLDRLAQLQRAFSIIFYNAGHLSADYIIDQIINAAAYIDGKRLITAYCFLTTETERLKAFQNFIYANPDLYITSCVAQIWGATQTTQSLINREMSYYYIDDVVDSDSKDQVNLPTAIIAGYHMHSSYGFSSKKHSVKTLITRYIINNCPDSLKQKLKKLENQFKTCSKKSIFVVLDHFSKHHSVYRVLGLSIFDLKKKYKIIAIVQESMIAGTFTDIFDEVIVLNYSGDIYSSLKSFIECVEQVKPYTIFYPSIGMSPWTICYSSFRLAPLQVTSLGHAASSMSPNIDYFFAEEDFIGDLNTYTEKVAKIEAGTMSFAEPDSVEYPQAQIGDSSVLNLSVNGSYMKINSALLSICRNIYQSYLGTAIKINFHFFVYGLKQDLHGIQFKMMVESYLPDVIIHFNQPFQDYLHQFSKMDIVLNPFPYGNMNSLIDSFKLGVVPICMQGKHIHENIDAGLITRLGLPGFIIAHNEVEYECATRRLIENPQYLKSIKDMLFEKYELESIFTSKTHGVSMVLEQILLNHEVLQ